MTVVWDGIVGQERAVDLLKRAAERPVHAYLLVGPRGCGVEDAARAFAATLVAGDDARATDLVRRRIHPDVVEVDPPTTQLRVEDARRVIDAAYRSPVEGDRKVIIVFDAERLNDAAANKLLKTLEEPPPGAFLVLVTAGADQLLPTIRSRCQRIDFAFLGSTTVVAALESAGVEPERARLLAGLAGGRLDRARALDGRMAATRRGFVDAAGELDGSGAGVAVHAELIQAALQEAVTALEVAQGVEAAELEAVLEAAGYPERVARAQRREVEERHRREHRRARTDALIEGITALETMYRDALAAPGATPLNADRPVLTSDPRACVRALEACRRARQALAEHNPNEGLLLEWLLLHLPAVADEADR